MLFSVLMKKVMKYTAEEDELWKNYGEILAPPSGPVGQQPNQMSFLGSPTSHTLYSIKKAKIDYPRMNIN